MNNINLNDFIPGLWKLQMEIDEAYRGIHFLWNRGFYDESEAQNKKYEELKRKKDQLLKPIFGS